jgi:hypothetical protein
MSSDVVDLHLTYTDAEMVAAIRCAYRHTYRITTRAMIACAAAIAGCLGATIYPGTLLCYILALAGGLMLASYAYMYWYWPWKIAKKLELSQATRMAFSNEDVIYSSEDSEARLKWSYYRAVWESDDFYFLVRRKRERASTFIPKRAFSCAAQEDIFRQLLSRHLSYETKGLTEKQRARIEAEYVPKSIEPPDWR